MSTDRRFAAFSKNAALPRMNEIPEGGFCISAFVIISRKDSPDEVLLGHLNLDADWQHIGALDRERAERNAKGWMIPSSHLLLEESPQDTAERILLEQLGITHQKLQGPSVFSEAYSQGKARNAGTVKHWDLEFVFQGERSDIAAHPAWRELRFVDLRRTKTEDMARLHEDILAHIGKWKQNPPA